MTPTPAPILDAIAASSCNVIAVMLIVGALITSLMIPWSSMGAKPDEHH